MQVLYSTVFSLLRWPLVSTWNKMCILAATCWEINTGNPYCRQYGFCSRSLLRLTCRMHHGFHSFSQCECELTGKTGHPKKRQAEPCRENAKFRGCLQPFSFSGESYCFYPFSMPTSSFAGNVAGGQAPTASAKCSIKWICAISHQYSHHSMWEGCKYLT